MEINKISDTEIEITTKRTETKKDLEFHKGQVEEHLKEINDKLLLFK